MVCRSNLKSWRWWLSRPATSRRCVNWKTAKTNQPTDFPKCLPDLVIILKHVFHDSYWSLLWFCESFSIFVESMIVLRISGCFTMQVSNLPLQRMFQETVEARVIAMIVNHFMVQPFFQHPDKIWYIHKDFGVVCGSFSFVSSSVSCSKMSFSMGMGKGPGISTDFILICCIPNPFDPFHLFLSSLANFEVPKFQQHVKPNSFHFPGIWSSLYTG